MASIMAHVLASGTTTILNPNPQSIGHGPKAIAHSVCVVGAGPSGLQLGHFLLRDSSELGSYKIFEQAKYAGSFFVRYPVHRSLISLNKRHTRVQNPEFRMRHDWNSLLGSEEAGVKPVTERTVELYPHADVLANYLRDFAAEQEAAGRIEYATQVSNINQLADLHGFEMDVTTSVKASGENIGRTHQSELSMSETLETLNVTTEKRHCKRILLATGLSKPRLPEGIIGLDNLIGYEQLPDTGNIFENKSVLLWGFGNAAHETARELQKYTKTVTLLHRRASQPGNSFSLQSDTAAGLPRLALFTHYPGDVRTVTMQIYDSYLLKALDVKLPYADTEEPVFLRCLDDKICVWVSKKSRCGGAGVQRQIFPKLEVAADSLRRCALELSAFDPQHTVAAPLMAILRNLTGSGLLQEGRDFQWGPPTDARKMPALSERVFGMGHATVEEYIDARARDLGIDNSAFELRGRRLEIDSHFLASVSGRPLLDTIARLRPILAQDPLRQPFDAAIRCLGWKMNDKIFNPALRHKVADVQESLPFARFMNSGSPPIGKYPRVGPAYEAPNVPGLYYAGALAHGRDYRRSAGGFIHGFRYTARALHRALRREIGLSWPNRSFPLGASVQRAALMRQVWQRINEAAGPYQMFDELADAIIFYITSDGILSADYLEEVPMAYVHEDSLLSKSPRLLLSFVYGKQFSPLDLPSPGAVGAEFGELSSFLHPRLELFEGFPGSGSPPAMLRQRPLMVHALVEDVLTEWTSHIGHVDPLLRFLSKAIDRVGEIFGQRLDGALRHHDEEATTVGLELFEV